MRNSNSKQPDPSGVDFPASDDGDDKPPVPRHKRQRTSQRTVTPDQHGTDTPPEAVGTAAAISAAAIPWISSGCYSLKARVCKAGAAPASGAVSPLCEGAPGGQDSAKKANRTCDGVDAAKDEPEPARRRGRKPAGGRRGSVKGAHKGRSPQKERKPQPNSEKEHEENDAEEDEDEKEEKAAANQQAVPLRRSTLRSSALRQEVVQKPEREQQTLGPSSRSHRKRHPIYQIEEDEVDEAEEDDEEEHVGVRKRHGGGSGSKKRQKARKAVKAAPRVGGSNDASSSDGGTDVPLARARSRRVASHYDDGAAAVTSSKRQRGSPGKGDRGSGRLRRTSMGAATASGNDNIKIEEALDDDFESDDVIQMNTKRAPIAGNITSGRVDRSGGKRVQRSLRKLKKRKALTVEELRAKARRKLDQGAEETDVEEEGEEEIGAVRGGEGRLHRLQHPGLDEGVDAEAAAHALYNSDDDQAALEDDVGPVDAGGAVSDQDDVDSFINDSDEEEVEIGDEEEEEKVLKNAAGSAELRTPKKARRGGGVGVGGSKATKCLSQMRSPPLVGRMNTDKLENFKSWVTPMLCDLLHLTVVDDDQNELIQNELDQKARAQRFDQDLAGAVTRAASYNWVRAVTKMNLTRVLQRYPSLLIDGMALIQFYGAAGTHAVHASIDEEDQLRSQTYLQDHDECLRCDICNARRTHRLHQLTLQGDPVDGIEEEEESDEEGGGEAAAEKRTHQFLAGGMCCDRVVLYHALCHFKRWLLASLKKRLKFLLRVHLRNRNSNDVLSDDVRSDAMLRMLSNEDKFLTAMYCKYKELMQAAEQLYMGESKVSRREERFRPGRLVAEIMFELHDSIDGYESDIPCVPSDVEDGEEEEEEGEGEEVSIASGAGFGTSHEDGGGHIEDDDDAVGGDGEQGDDAVDRQVNCEGRKKMQRRRRLGHIFIEDGDDDEEAPLQGVPLAGGRNAGLTGAAGAAGTSGRAPCLDKLRESTRRRRTLESSAVGEAAAANEVADTVECAAVDNVNVAVAFVKAECAAASVAASEHDLPQQSPSIAPSQYLSGGGRRRQATIEEFLKPQRGSQRQQKTLDESRHTLDEVTKGPTGTVEVLTLLKGSSNSSAGGSTDSSGKSSNDGEQTRGVLAALLPPCRAAQDQAMAEGPAATVGSAAGHGKDHVSAGSHAAPAPEQAGQKLFEALGADAATSQVATAGSECSRLAHARATAPVGSVETCAVETSAMDIAADTSTVGTTAVDNSAVDATAATVPLAQNPRTVGPLPHAPH